MPGETIDAEDIEHDIRRTQDEIGATVQKLEEQLTLGKLARSVVGDEGMDLIQEIAALAKRNPVPVAMIAVGAIWLLARSEPGTFTRFGKRLGEASDYRPVMSAPPGAPAPAF
jgi:hypothetical protein